MPDFGASIVAAVSSAAASVGSAVGSAALGVGASASTAAGLASGVTGFLGGLGGVAASGTILAHFSLGTFLSTWATVASIGSLVLGTPRIGGSFDPVQFSADPYSGIPYVIGETGLGGKLIHEKRTGSDNEFHHWWGVLSGGGPIEGITSFSATQTLDGNDPAPIVISFDGSGLATTAPFTDHMGLITTTGATPDTALTQPPNSGEAVTEWTSAHKLSGKAAFWWSIDNDPGVYEQGEPKPQFVVKGPLCYDPRLDSTQTAIGGSGSHRWADPSDRAAYMAAKATWTWSEDPYIQALNWLLGRWESPAGEPMKLVLGVGAPIDKIELADFVEGANVCDTNGWTCGGVVYSTDSLWEVSKAMLQAGSGIPLLKGGKIGCMVNTPRVSLGVVTAADVRDTATISKTAPRRDRKNQIVPTYREPGENWQMLAAEPVKVDAYETIDRGHRSQEITYALVQNVAQAGVLARYDVENTREGGGTLPMLPAWLGFKLGDCVTVNDASLGLTAQKIIITGRQLDLATGASTWTFRTEGAANANKHSDALGHVIAEPPALPDPVASDPPEITGFGITTDWNESADGDDDPAAVFDWDTPVSASIKRLVAEVWPVADATKVRRTPILQVNTTPHYITKGVVPGLSMEGRLVGLNARGVEVAYTDAVAFSIDRAAPSAPASVGLTSTYSADWYDDNGDGKVEPEITVGWTCVSAPAKGTYEIEDRPSTGGVWRSQHLSAKLFTPGGAGEAVIRGALKGGKQRRVRMRFLDQYGTPSAWAPDSTGALVTVGTKSLTAGTLSGPTNTVLTAKPNGNLGEWDNPTIKDLAYIQVYRTTANSAPVYNASLLKKVDGESFKDRSAAIGTAYYYWVRAFDHSGNYSAAVQVGSASVTTRALQKGDVDADETELRNSKGKSRTSINYYDTFQAWTSGAALPDGWTKTGGSNLTVTKQTSGADFDHVLELESTSAANGQYIELPNGSYLKLLGDADYLWFDYELAWLTGDLSRAGLSVRLIYQDASNYKSFPVSFYDQHTGLTAGERLLGGFVVPATVVGAPTGKPQLAHIRVYANSPASAPLLSGPAASVKKFQLFRFAPRKAAKEEIKAYRAITAAGVPQYSDGTAIDDLKPADPAATAGTAYQQTTEPTGGAYSHNDVWIDTSVSDRVIRWWDSLTSAWKLPATGYSRNFANANKAINPEDKVVYVTGTITGAGARTYTLPLASSVPAGWVVQVRDLSGSLVDDTIYPLISVQGSDTLNGVTLAGGGGTSKFDTAYGRTEFTSDGVSAWVEPIQSLKGGGTGASSAGTARTKLNAASLGQANTFTALQTKIRNSGSDLDSWENNTTSDAMRVRWQSSGTIWSLTPAPSGTADTTKDLYYDRPNARWAVKTDFYVAGSKVVNNADEGSFTPTITFVTAGDLSVSYATQAGRYKRVGNVVHVWINLTFTPTFTTASGSFRIGTLPVAAGSATLRDNAVGEIRDLGTMAYPTSRTHARAYLPTTTTIGLLGMAAGAAGTVFGAGQMPTGVAQTVTLYICYEAA